MSKQIKVGDTFLTVSSLYPYRYDYGQGKEALRIEVERTSHNYPEIEGALENPAGDIEYLEDGEVVNLYRGYTRDFRCNYQDGVYQVELSRVSPLELEVEDLKARVAHMAQLLEQGT